MVLVTDERCTGYSSIGHPERPERILRSTELLRSQTALEITWETSAPAPHDALLRAHVPEHIERIRAAKSDFDGDTPAHPDIFDHAARSVGGALRCLELARAGGRPFSLFRPPGHHATRDRAMGFCYLNNVAIAALHALATGASRVGVFDFDVHHGNGTESILVNHPGAAFASVHQHPCYPGTGESDTGENCFNHPVPPHTPRETYRRKLEAALARLLETKPELLFVSAGFDAYVRDPLAQETLETEDFQWIGEQLRKTSLPIVSVLEGGYSRELPTLILAYLTGLDG